MIIERIIVGPLETNCYILADEKTKDAVIIDPGGDYSRIQKRIEKLGLKPLCVINTHGHGDHIGANEKFDLPIWAHKLDADFLTDPDKNLSGAFFAHICSPPADRLLEGGEKIKAGSLKLEIIHTPGHTPGGICVKCGKALFTGDTLFYQSIGRTDIPMADTNDLLRSIKTKLMVLDDDIFIYPGHGPESTIGEERRNNPFLNDK
jgi:glyoxylase-like metal-dependent hydrolase (beta-lactamase superfamily II)